MQFAAYFYSIAQYRSITSSSEFIGKRKRLSTPPPRYPVTAEIEGKRYKGAYRTAGKILAAATGRASNSSRSGRRQPKT